jgi:hypothetical protein
MPHVVLARNPNKKPVNTMMSVAQRRRREEDAEDAPAAARRRLAAGKDDTDVPGLVAWQRETDRQNADDAVARHVRVRRYRWREEHQYGTSAGC